MARRGMDLARLRFAMIALASVIGAVLGALVVSTLAWIVNPISLALVIVPVSVLSAICSFQFTRRRATSRHRFVHQIPTDLAPSSQPWKQLQDQDFGRAQDRYSDLPHSSRPQLSPEYSNQPDLNDGHLNHPESSRAKPFQPSPAVKAPTHAVTAVDPPQVATPADDFRSGWWNQAGRHPVAASAEAPQREIPDISSYVGLGQIVQCTRCAAFAVNVNHVQAGFSFRCQACDHEFTWQRGEEWPAWKVSPRSRLSP